MTGHCVVFPTQQTHTLSHAVHAAFINGDAEVNAITAMLRRIRVKTTVYAGGGVRHDLFLQDNGQPAANAGHPRFAFRGTPRSLRPWQRVLEAHDGHLGPPGQASLYFNDPFGPP